MTRSDPAGTGASLDADPTTLLIFGAGGRLGRLLVEEGLRRGHRVRAMVHRTNPLAPHPSLEVRRGDIHAVETLDRLFVGIDRVLASLGSAGARTPDVAGTGARVVSRMMTVHGLNRLVSVTGSGAMLPGEHVTGHHAVKRTQMAHGAPHLLADGDDHLAVLADSDLDWTAIRVPAMTTAGTGTGHTISRAALHPTATIPYRAAAAAMLDVAENGSWSRASPFVAAQPTTAPAPDMEKLPPL